MFSCWKSSGPEIEDVLCCCQPKACHLNWTKLSVSRINCKRQAKGPHQSGRPFELTAQHVSGVGSGWQDDRPAGKRKEMYLTRDISLNKWHNGLKFRLQQSQDSTDAMALPQCLSSDYNLLV